MATAAVAEPIPLTRLDPPGDQDDTASTTNTAVQNDTDTASASTTVASPQEETNAPPRPTTTRRLSRLQSIVRGAGSMNSLGALTLAAAVVFGIGAWVGMKIQISQGGKNMELAIWTACADHESIQHTALCKSILAKDFSQFEKRKDSHIEVEVLAVKRGIEEDATPMPGADTGSPLSAEKSADEKKGSREPSRYEKYLSGLSSADKNWIQNPRVQVWSGEERTPPDPAVRATFLPLVDLLMKPIKAVFEVPEYIFLVMIYSVHKVFSWIANAIIFVIQGVIYSLIEGIFRRVLFTIDMYILQVLPRWLPPFFVSDIASLLCFTALDSYWFSTSYFSSLKCILLFRFYIWVVFYTLSIVVPILWNLWQSRHEVVEDRRSNLPSWPETPAWLRRTPGDSASSSSFSSPSDLPLQQDPSATSRTQFHQRTPLRADQRAKEEASAEELFFARFGRPKARAKSADEPNL